MDSPAMKSMSWLVPWRRTMSSAIRMAYYHGKLAALKDCPRLLCSMKAPSSLHRLTVQGLIRMPNFYKREAIVFMLTM